MKLLQSIINEGGMKDAAMDLIDKAAKDVPKGADIDAYLMKVVAKVLELDTEKLFKGDFKAIEDMVRAQLDESITEAVDQYDVCDENDPKSEVYFSGTKAECEEWIDQNEKNDQYKDKKFSAVRSLEEATGDEKFDNMMGGVVAAADGAKEVTKKDLSKLINELDDDARHAGVILKHDARYKSVDFSWEHQILYWVTQATSKPAEKAEAAQAIADEMSDRGFRGWTVKVTIRDDYVGNGDESKWQVAKTK